MTVFSQWEQEGLQPSEGWLQDVKRGEEEDITANCTIIDHFLHLNRDWSPRFSTLRDKNGWVRAKTA
eukprot:COSAG06_NODE_104_length_23856_cov_6.259629_18_plen_67_part_00